MTNETQQASKLEKDIQAHLLARETMLDADARAKLAEIRHKALNQAVKSGWLQHWLMPGYMPALAASVCAVLIVSAMLLRQPAISPDNGTDTFTLAELVDDPEELEAITDPGFYAWLDEVDAQNGSNGAV